MFLVRVDSLKKNIITFLFSVIFFFSIFDFSRIISGGYESIQTYFKGGLYIIVIISFLIIGSENIFKKWMLQNKLLLLYLIYCMLSLIWSREPLITMTGLIVLSSVLLMTSMIGWYLSREQIFFAIYLVCAFYVLSGVFLHINGGDVYYDFTQGIYRLAGFTFGPHALARVSGLVFIFTFWILIKKIHLGLVLYAASLTLGILSVFVIFFTDSRQALVASVISVFVIYYIYFVRGRKFVFSALFFVFIAIAFLIIFYSDSFDLFSIELLARSNLDELVTLTGRVFIWDSSIALIKENFFLGYGFNAGGKILENSYQTYFGWSTQSAHNLLLHAMLDVGFLGSIFLMGWLFSCYRVAIFERDFFSFVLLIYFTVIMFVERGFAGSPGFEFIAILSILAAKKPILKL